jgi:hypothetical protein
LCKGGVSRRRRKGKILRGAEDGIIEVVNTVCMELSQ